MTIYQITTLALGGLITIAGFVGMYANNPHNEGE